MVNGGRFDGEAQGMSVRRTIQSIKEIVSNHSEADIYAALKESNMDPNETAQKLLNQDPFHEVKRKRDKRKENAGYKASTERRVHPEYYLQRARSYSSWVRNARGGSQTRKTVPAAGISREFRIVRDNRVNQKTTEDHTTNRDVKTESVQNLPLGNQQVKPNIVEKSSGGILTGQKHSAGKNSGGQMLSQSLNRHSENVPGHTNSESSSGMGQSLAEEIHALPNSSRIAKGDGQSSSQMYPATGGSTNSHIGVYSSSSDPVHVPSPDSRLAGTVGAIGCEVRAVGARRLSLDRPPSHPAVSNSSLLIPQMGKDITSKESISHSASSSKSSSQTPGLEPVIQNTPLGKSISSSQYNIRSQQPATHQKAVQPNMEWKPKTTQKPSLISGGVLGISSLSSSDVANSTGSDEVEVAGLSDTVAQINISIDEHVIIPHHLQVPESERIQFIFGSFEAGFELNRGATSSKASRNVELHDESTMSASTSVPVSSGEDDSADEQASLGDSQGRNSPSESPESAAESEKPQPENDESSPTKMESYADIGVVQGHNPPYISSEPQQLNSPSPPSFSAYIPQTSYGMPFFRTTVEDNARGQNFVSTSEALSSHAANSSPRSALAQQQQLVQQQHQPVAQMYPQVHVSHLPNFVPYRHVYSPVYASPMAMPNYTGNPTYPHPSNANSYLLMPGGTSHINSAAVKYANSQFKPVPTGYGNFTNPAGYTMATPGSIGNATVLDDSTRIKYKDNNLYTSNPQAETQDIWIQTPQELPGLQSTPYYNLTGQAPQPAFLPTHAGHAPFSPTAQSPHLQFPGLYHTPQQPSIANPHHLVPQQLVISLLYRLYRILICSIGARSEALDNLKVGFLLLRAVVINHEGRRVARSSFSVCI
ncbi:hypothetical protein J5N97_006820 [Dioscorea zingiberensis]|uniref:GBF-interacting protein 1 N-terminal domain-containing protein n=1 Tax=Dioscorea zingiberensis TaxID=325984 RepID=A0A9D5DC24_9LILI|nr:hypothetical protein J5N97_006820 [Dioscorea zingiberensis]